MDLLDHLAEMPPPVHMVMPCMALACGLPLLGCREPRTLTTTKTTCPGCLSAHGDRAGLRAETYRQQGHQQGAAT